MSAKMPVLDENTINGFQTNEMNTLNMMSQISNKEKGAEVHMLFSPILQISLLISPTRWVFEQEFVIDKRMNN